MSAPAQLELSGDPFGQATDPELLTDASDAALFLRMGYDGMSAATLERMRRQLLDAVGELARRWTMDGAR